MLSFQTDKAEHAIMDIQQCISYQKNRDASFVDACYLAKLKKNYDEVSLNAPVCPGQSYGRGPGEQPPLQLMDLSNLQSTYKIFFSVHSIPTCGEYSFFLVFCINFLKYIFTITYSFTIQFRYRDDELLLCQEVVVENMDE